MTHATHTPCMCQAPLALLDELLTQMGLVGFTPADAGADEGPDAGLLSRWVGLDAGAMAGDPPTTVIEAAERRIQLGELSRQQLRVLLVKLGGADAGGEHLQMDKRALLRAAREAMGAAPLVLLDEARASSFGLQPALALTPTRTLTPTPSPRHLTCVYPKPLARSRPASSCSGGPRQSGRPSRRASGRRATRVTTAATAAATGAAARPHRHGARSRRRERATAARHGRRSTPPTRRAPRRAPRRAAG